MAKDNTLNQALLVGGLALGGYLLYVRAKGGAQQDVVMRSVSDIVAAVTSNRTLALASPTSASPRAGAAAGVSASAAAGARTTAATVLPAYVAEAYDLVVPAALAARTPETLDSIEGNGMTAPTLEEALVLSALGGEPVRPEASAGFADLWAVFAAALGKSEPDPLPLVHN